MLNFNYVIKIYHLMKSLVTNKILMIKPNIFGSNPETLHDNIFQRANSVSEKEIVSDNARIEFKNFVKILKDNGINVVEFSTKSTNLPDSIYSNNWISTHQDGTIYLYPMFSHNRRGERRSDVVNFLIKNYNVNKVIDDAQFYEKKQIFLEGTGSLVLDRLNKIAFANSSIRTSQILFNKWVFEMGYKGFFFNAHDNSKPIYHTNVILSICSKLVFVCFDVLEKSTVYYLKKIFKKNNKVTINITKSQMHNFLGNVIELKNNLNQLFLIMSTKAYRCITEKQLSIINKYNKILHSPLDVIENYGGGGARCIITEIFLQKKMK